MVEGGKNGKDKVREEERGVYEDPCLYTYTVYLDIEKYHESSLLTLCNNLHISPPMERLRAVRPAASLANSLAPAARRLLARATWL